MRKSVIFTLFVAGILITACGENTKCDDYVDELCDYCGGDSDTCIQADEATSAEGFECNETDAQTNIDKIKNATEDEKEAICNPSAI